MRYISLVSLYVGLLDLLDKRILALQMSATGAASVKLLKGKLDALGKLPAVGKGRPLVDELDAADGRHDALGYAIWHLLEAYLVHPDTPPETRDAAKKIRAAFIPTLEDLHVSYPAQVKAAMDRKTELQSLDPLLASFPVFVGGATLRDWVDAFLTAGTNIDELLSARADLEARSRKDASRLRGELIGLLNRMRKNLAMELAEDPTLPRDLDAQVFGYLDLLERSAADAQAKGKTVQEIPPPPPETA